MCAYLYNVHTYATNSWEPCRRALAKANRWKEEYRILYDAEHMVRTWTFIGARGWMDGWTRKQPSLSINTCFNFNFLEHGSWYRRKTEQNPSPQLNFFLEIGLNECRLQQKNTGLPLQITIQTTTSAEVPCHCQASWWRASERVIDMQSVMVRWDDQRDAEWGCFPLNRFYNEDFEIPWTFVTRSVVLCHI